MERARPSVKYGNMYKLAYYVPLLILFMLLIVFCFVSIPQKPADVCLDPSVLGGKGMLSSSSWNAIRGFTRMEPRALVITEYSQALASFLSLIHI